MTGTSLFIVVRRQIGGANLGPRYYGTGTQEQAQAALATLEGREAPPAGVKYEWGVAELLELPVGVDSTADGMWLACEQAGVKDQQGEAHNYYGPMVEDDAKLCVEALQEAPLPENGWRDVWGSPVEMEAFPS